eukprot:CAMPEP_0115872094 /NCGR_PEP_ID=MMETSP0287-20121206/23239_1 /TAXON_ID=412157 /ORGANISM="Chrysochromulina rotalis, Strain UIO044" /LENGTH=90 /DNA_ID=CAMNT_0003326985 /DNA_START=280 /DNA_END=552 /DNA_ORIENTATION=+
MAAWMAVPWATASSGDTSQLGSRPPKWSRSSERSRAIREEPPTSTSSSTSAGAICTRESTSLTGWRARSSSGVTIFSNPARSTVSGPAAV